jgi:hypothetical protein
MTGNLTRNLTIKHLLHEHERDAVIGALRSLTAVRARFNVSRNDRPKDSAEYEAMHELSVAVYAAELKAIGLLMKTQEDQRGS